MKKTKIVAALVCAFALCLALAGCSGGTNGGGAANDDANFQGDWMLSGGTSDGTELDADSIKAMEDMGLYVYISLNEDKSAVISMFGTNMEGTWEAKDATTVALTIEGDTEDATLEGDELVLAVDGDSLRFTKGEIPAAALETGTDAEQAAEPEA